MPDYAEYIRFDMPFDDFWDFMIEVDRIDDAENDFEIKLVPTREHTYQIKCMTRFITSIFSENMLKLLEKYNFEKY